ncbi:hypothetical protein [Actinocrispum wychmicini]|uniref:Uncharacterized protein n=1 Tax=Actinocrispum wychmicini TaxID=1213861 RepID=A0A4R2JDN1_9PSEU|nr:hypothetical protein [Actinocrispum wychmicini]TCO54936.1 hypothetical protein EV192_108224 [Actinocrispum wychmicini]
MRHGGRAAGEHGQPDHDTSEEQHLNGRCNTCCRDVGTTSKTLGPALRLGWMVLPALGHLGDRWHPPGDHPQGIIVGYGTPPEHGYAATLDVFAHVLRSVTPRMIR